MRHHEVMTRITVLGGTGYAGSAIVAEAVRRGHEVVSFSRRLPDAPVDGATYVTGDLLDEGVLARAVADAEVVVQTLSPRGDLAGKVEGLMDRLIELASERGVRLGVLGGASSLKVAEDGPRLLDLSEPPPDVKPEIMTGIAVLEALQQSPDSVDWFYISPGQHFGAWEPGEARGTYRVGGEVLLKDENGRSHISSRDLALAFLDEIERPHHRRARFHVAY